MGKNKRRPTFKGPRLKNLKPPSGYTSAVRKKISRSKTRYTFRKK